MKQHSSNLMSNNESPLLCSLVFSHFLLLEVTGMTNLNTLRRAENNMKWLAIGKESQNCSSRMVAKQCECLEVKLSKTGSKEAWSWNLSACWIHEIWILKVEKQNTFLGNREDFKKNPKNKNSSLVKWEPCPLPGPLCNSKHNLIAGSFIRMQWTYLISVYIGE